MCFEWDKRYFRELEEKKSREKLDAMLKEAEEAVKQQRDRDDVKSESRQPSNA